MKDTSFVFYCCYSSIMVLRKINKFFKRIRKALVLSKALFTNLLHFSSLVFIDNATLNVANAELVRFISKAIRIISF